MKMEIFLFILQISRHITTLSMNVLRCLALRTDKVKVQNALVGGGFGGKEDMTVQHHGISSQPM